MVDSRPVTLMRYLPILACCIGLPAAAQRGPTEVLRSVTEKVLASARSIPNYTCVQTVTRDFYRPVAATLPRACALLLEERLHPAPDLALRLMSTDRLRLEVAMVAGREVFSWAGASRFNDAGIEHVVSSGPIGTGAFGGFLNAAFQRDVRKFNFARSTVVDGRLLMEYDFQVDRLNSSYVVQFLKSWYRTAYSGTLLVDPAAGDVVRLALTTGELPPASGKCQTITTLDFRTVKIGSAQVLLPERARQRFVLLNGEETENTTSFSNCREYRGESTVTFFQEPETPAGGEKPRLPAETLPLPSGLRFTLELTAPISSATAAAGDRFTARLAETFHDGFRQVLAAKGTPVEGRVMRVETFRYPHAEVFLVLKPETLRIPGAPMPLTAVRDWAYLQQQARKRIEILLPRRGEEHSGVFRFPGNPVRVKAGYRSTWKTEGPSERDISITFH